MLQIPKCPQHATDVAGNSMFQDLLTCSSTKARESDFRSAGDCAHK